VAASVYVTLLRAVNLAGLNMIAMADLRDLVGRLGYRDATTLLQSGNVVFTGAKKSTGAIERALEASARKVLTLDIPFFVRTATEWADIIAANPFPREAANDPGHLLVVCLKTAPASGAATTLQKAIKGREIVRVVGRQAYVTYPDGIGKSKLTNAMIEKALATRGTARNWNTVLKLQALASRLGGGETERRG
jgi:uncharacterized protein (DUF1697 family)